MLSVFVTGHRGLLGSTLCRTRGDAPFAIHVFDGDISDQTAIDAFVSGLPSLDVVIHTAAATDVNRCEREPEWAQRVNVEGTRHVCQAAARRGARFLYLSTVSVFSGERGDYREMDDPDPRNHYNQTKHEGERVTLSYDKGLVVRTNVIGVHPDGSRGKNFMEWLVDSVRQHKDLTLFTDVRINPLSHWTLAEFLSQLATQWPASRILHLGSRTLLSKAEIGKAVLATFSSYRGNVEYTTSDALSASAFRPKEMWLNVGKAEELGFRLPTLEEEIERILKQL